MSEMIQAPAPTTEPSFWSTVKAKLKPVGMWFTHKLIGPIVALVLVAVAVMLAAMGWQELQIGGLLAKLFGKKKPEQKAIAIANSVPPDRVDPEGRIIPPGVPDSQGNVQAVVVPIKEPNLLSNPKTVKFTPPGEKKPVEIQLPDGVRARDIDKVIVVKPETVAVTVKDNSGITAHRIDDLLSKYAKK